MNDKLIALRHDVHMHPEVSGAERETAARIVRFLEALAPDALMTGLGGHGVLATFDSGQPGPAVLFRCELDALPIVETNTFAHASRNAGVSHKCGHDGHMAIQCGLAEALAAKRPARGKVYLLFQPAEETGAGAEAVLLDPRFAEIKPDMAIAVHDMPGYPIGTVALKDGTITASVSGLAIRLQGRTSHASQPEQGLNPALAIAELLTKTDALNLNDPSSPDFRLITPVHVSIGTPHAFGVTAGDGELQLTLRGWDDARLEALRERIKTLAVEIAGQHELHVAFESMQTFRANNNDPAVNALVRAGASDAALTVLTLSEPVKGGEDFGLFSARFPCALVLLGAGDTTALHSPDFDFPDALIEPGVRLVNAIARRVLG